MKKYIIKSDFDFEKICYATLKKVYSVSLFPRILINAQNGIFEKNFNKKAYFECFFTQKSVIFSKKVHRDCFDVGLFFCEKDKKTILKIYDGNGYCAGKSITNIFDFCLNLNVKEFQNFKKQIDESYKKLNRKKLLFQKI